MSLTRNGLIETILLGLAFRHFRDGFRQAQTVNINLFEIAESMSRGSSAESLISTAPRLVTVSAVRVPYAPSFPQSRGFSKFGLASPV
jgi:hypothetical protein